MIGGPLRFMAALRPGPLDRAGRRSQLPGTTSLVVSMAKLRSSLALLLALSGCAGLVPPSATPSPALAEKVHSLMGEDRACSRPIAGALAAYHLTADGISSIDLTPVPPADPTDYFLPQRQAWVRRPGQPGQIVVQYDRGDCRIATVYARDGATLPAV
jgi:hypothetical protein